MNRKIIKIGKSLGVTIPKNVLVQLGLHPGDSIEVSASRGVVVLSPAQKQNSRQDKIARATYDFVDRYRDDLEALAQ